MACFHPLTGYRAAEPHPVTGKRGLVFNSKAALIEGGMVKIACGQCFGCRTDKAQMWSIRCAHEAAMHERNCFLTLTYDQQNVPPSFSVNLRDPQLFLKRLRKKAGARLSFFSVGEYGEQDLRPHVHMLIFGFDFADKKPWSKRGEYPTFKSDTLSELWPFGLHEIGSVTHESSGYLARYTLKKITGRLADDHYWRRSPIDGQMYRVAPEFATMSRRPGIGQVWFDKFATDAFPSDFLVVGNNRKVRPPQFYLSRLPEAAQVPIKRARKRAAVSPAARANSTPERLRVREEVKVLKLKRLKREL